MLEFQVTEAFFCEQMKSEYVPGQTYRVRPGNDKLAALLKKWLDEKKAVIVGTNRARVAGQD